MLHTDVAKVDWDVAHVALNVSEVHCKCLFKMFHLFQAYVVVSVLSGCCICFTHMLQVFYLDIAYVSHICCNSMFHLCQTYVVASVSGGTVSDGCTAQAPGDGARQSWGPTDRGLAS